MTLHLTYSRVDLGEIEIILVHDKSPLLKIITINLFVLSSQVILRAINPF